MCECVGLSVGMRSQSLQDVYTGKLTAHRRCGRNVANRARPSASERLARMPGFFWGAANLLV
jgi:hypothetical protein